MCIDAWSCISCKSLLQLHGMLLTTSSKRKCSSMTCTQCAAAACRGRVRLQVMGFMWVFVIFLVCAIFYHDLIKKQYIAVFQARLAVLLEICLLQITFLCWVSFLM